MFFGSFLPFVLLSLAAILQSRSDTKRNLVIANAIN
jgi:hypothetical protein